MRLGDVRARRELGTPFPREKYRLTITVNSTGTVPPATPYVLVVTDSGGASITIDPLHTGIPPVGQRQPVDLLHPTEVSSARNHQHLEEKDSLSLISYLMTGRA